jgi:hypothetical protein
MTNYNWPAREQWAKNRRLPVNELDPAIAELCHA